MDPAPRSLRFGPFRLDLAASQLLLREEPVHLTPKAFGLLRLLARRPGELVTKAQVFAELWRGLSVTDDALTRCVRELRAALGDDARRPQIVQTVHRRGFRFVAPIAPLGPDSAPAPLVGRSAELAAAREWLEAPSDGRIKLLSISGEPGVGKTRLAREIAGIAARAGALVLWSQTPGDEGAPPYDVWRQLLAASRHDRSAASVANAAIEPQDGRQRVFGTTVRALAELSAQRAALLVLDDLQGSDRDSLNLLDHLLQDVEDPRLSIVCTVRDVGAPPNAALRELLDAANGPGRRALALRGLGLDDVGALLASWVGAERSRELAALALAKSGGNPLYLSELAELVPSDPDEAPSLDEAPDRVRPLITHRLESVSQRCTEVLAAAAVVGTEVAPGRLREIALLTSEAFDEGLGEALAERLLVRAPDPPERVRFTHGLVREVAYERATPGVRARLHRRVAHALERDARGDEGEQLSALAHHFGRSLLAGDAERAIDYALRAGERAFAQHAFEEAAAHFGSALDALEAAESPDPERTAQAALAAARAHAVCARGDLARSLAGRAIEAARRSGSARAFRDAVAVLCDLQPSYGRDARARALLDEALAATGDDEPAARAQLHSLRGLMAFLDADLATHEAASLEALRLARDSGDPAARLEALRVRCFGLNHPSTEREWNALCDERVSLALATGQLLQEFEARQQRLELLLQRCDPPGVASELGALEAIAERVSSPKMQATLLGIRAGLAIASGPPSEARRLTERAFALGRRIDYGEWWAIAQLQQSAILGFEDRGTEASGGVHRGTQSHAQVSLFRAGEIWLQCLAGRDAEARSGLLELAKDRFATLRRDVSYPLTISNLALSCAHLRCKEAAEVLRELLLPFAGRNLTTLCWYSAGCASRFVGLVTGTLERWDEAAQQFEIALATDRRCGARVWETHTALDYARVLLAQGGAKRAATARSLAREALATSNELGIAYTARLARELLAAAP